MTRKAAQEVFRAAGLTPNDVQVIELHDCFSCNELVTYEALGLCGDGEAARLVDSGNVTYGGKWVVNPSGGLISKGHPLGATGLAQCAELSWQLRRQCGNRQVPNATVALQHNIGLGGAAIVGLYRVRSLFARVVVSLLVGVALTIKAPVLVQLGFPEAFHPLPAGKPNHAVECLPAPAIRGPSTASTSGLTMRCPFPAATAGATFQTDAVFAALGEALKGNPDVVKKVNGVYLFKITSGGETKLWTVDLKNGAGGVQAMILGKTNGQQLFMGGKLKIAGNMALGTSLSLSQSIESHHLDSDDEIQQR